MKRKTKPNQHGQSPRAHTAQSTTGNGAYVRPRITAVADCMAAIEGSKYHGHLLECASDDYRCSPCAYEADE